MSDSDFNYIQRSQTKEFSEGYDNMSWDKDKDPNERLEVKALVIENSQGGTSGKINLTEKR